MNLENVYVCEMYLSVLVETVELSVTPMFRKPYGFEYMNWAVNTELEKQLSTCC
jgi:hypothetical protein